MEKITDINRLYEISAEIRELLVDELLTAGSGHSAGSFGMADVFTALYCNVLNIDPKNPNWEERDRVVLSNGHIVPIRYAAMARVGYFPIEELKTLRKLGSRLQGHPHNLMLPGIDASSGPLGQGISVAAGMALAGLMDGKRWRVYCLMGDGELDEGQVWEAFMFAGKYALRNLTVIIDRNNIQIDGYTEHVMPLEPLADKFRAFGWQVLEIDGHNMRQIVDACAEAHAIFEKPTVIIARTIAGKDIPFMEFKSEWHGKIPNKEEAEKAHEYLKQIRSLNGRITGEH